LKETFEDRHADLFDTQLWHGLQETIRSGEIVEITPYLHEARLRG
jgi:isocitrate dehydrogenase kinase/phosphatase